MIKAVIIDDEGKARETIRNIIGSYCSDVSIVAEARNVKTGLEVISRHEPEIVFLDIKMPDGTGFDLLNQLYKIEFKLIFITAFDEYAIQAFKFSALDYILKPVNPSSLIEAVEKAKDIIEAENIKLKLDTFLDNVDSPSKEPKKLVLNTHDSIYVVKTDDIIRCKSDQNYTEFFLNDEKKLVVSKTLKEYDEMLSNYGFFRVHQSHLINLSYMVRFDKSEGGFVVMKDEAYIPVSSRKRESLLQLFKNM